jgi:hypothetical protein
MNHFSPLLDVDLANKLWIEEEVVFLDMEVLEMPHTLKMETTIFIIILRTHCGDKQLQQLQTTW